MERKFRVVACFLLLTLFGCSGTGYLVEKPLILNPRGALGPADAELRSRSMKALLDAFTDNNWEVRRVDSDSGTIEAEACRRREHCAEVRATVGQDGTIEILRTPGQALSENEEVLLKRWMGRLQDSYEKYMRSGRR